MKLSISIFKLFSIILFSFFCHLAIAQESIYVQGVVLDLEEELGIPGVQIYNGNNEKVGVTDQDGKFAMMIHPQSFLKFSLIGFDDVDINLNGQQELKVFLRREQIDELVVEAEALTILVDKGELEIVGDYFHLRTGVELPNDTDTLVNRLIFQPSIYNATKKEYSYFRPLIVNGSTYRINRLRADMFDENNDELNTYILNHKLGLIKYTYHDSIYINPSDQDNDFRTDCFIAVNKVYASRRKDYLDTMTIAKGTINPFRFLDYSFDPVDLVDTNLIPKPELKLMTDAGVSRIGFLVNKAVIDKKDMKNLEELNSINLKVRDILNNEYASLKSISVTGYASPEGKYKQNHKLANDRTKLILSEITSSMNASVRKNMLYSTNSIVERWSKVATLMEQDSLELATKVRKIVDRNNDDYVNTLRSLRKLPEYRKIIVKEYLPRLRKVEYVLNYTVFRNLTYQEIKDKYLSGADVSRYEFWRLIDSETNDSLRWQMEDDAIKKYPNFTLAANRVAVRLLKNDSLNLNILKPCLDYKTPNAVLYNQALMALGLDEMRLADSLTRKLPDDASTNYLKSIIAIHNGRYADAKASLSDKGGLNYILLLLALKDNNTALDRIEEMFVADPFSENAKLWYIRAICHNRAGEDYSGPHSLDPFFCLEQAFLLDPSLKEIAVLDSDVNGLIEEEVK